jgi:hypothetical protein
LDDARFQSHVLGYGKLGAADLLRSLLHTSNQKAAKRTFVAFLIVFCIWSTADCGPKSLISMGAVEEATRGVEMSSLTLRGAAWDVTADAHAQQHLCPEVRRTNWSGTSGIARDARPS